MLAKEVSILHTREYILSVPGDGARLYTIKRAQGQYEKRGPGLYTTEREQRPSSNKWTAKKCCRLYPTEKAQDQCR